MAILDFLVELGVTQSKGEARRSIQKDNSISINGQRCQDIEQMVSNDDLFHSKYLLVQKGKKNKYIVSVE
jgi:tyrosyl-tRNA synthetase